MTVVAARSASLADLLRNARFEVLPLDGIEEQVRARARDRREGHGDRVAEPRHRGDARPDGAARPRRLRRPCRTSPLASCATRAHLDEVLDRALAAGVRELFVLAGDAPEPAGEFRGAADLLEAMGPRRAEFDAIGITGYPESHHLISDEETIRAMFAKAPMATHIVSQLCFDADVIQAWIKEVRRRGTDLPIWIGVPGPVPLLEAAARSRSRSAWASRPAS